MIRLECDKNIGDLETMTQFPDPELKQWWVGEPKTQRQKQEVILRQSLWLTMQCVSPIGRIYWWLLPKYFGAFCSGFVFPFRGEGEKQVLLQESEAYKSENPQMTIGNLITQVQFFCIGEVH